MLHRSHAAEADGAAVEDAAFESAGGEVSAAFDCVGHSGGCAPLRAFYTQHISAESIGDGMEKGKSGFFLAANIPLSTYDAVFRGWGFSLLCSLLELDDYDADAATRLLLRRWSGCRIFTCILEGWEG